MKIRIGFISNSSSTSFIIGVPNRELRNTLLSILQMHSEEFKDLLKPPYDTVDKAINGLILLFEEVSEEWLTERAKWVWIEKMKESYKLSKEQGLTPYYIHLDIVMQQILERIFNNFKSLAQDEVFIKQIKYP